MQSTEIGEAETGGELRARLARLCAALLCATLPDILAGRLGRSRRTMPRRPTRQARSGRRSRRLAGRGDCAGAQVRAFSPNPGAWTTWRGERLKLHRAVPLASARRDSGTGLANGHCRGDRRSRRHRQRPVLEVQPPGGRVMSRARLPEWPGNARRAARRE
jgi:methionyl-tRNA formyltransferase